MFEGSCSIKFFHVVLSKQLTLSALMKNTDLQVKTVITVNYSNFKMKVDVVV